MSKKVFGGPLLFIILGGLVLLAYRYLPFDSLLEWVRAGRGDTQIAGQPSPPVPDRQPPDSMTAPVASAAPERTERLRADSEPSPVAPAPETAIPDVVVESAAVSTAPPVPTTGARPPAVKMPQVSSPPPSAVLPLEVSPTERAAPQVSVRPKVQAPIPTPPKQPAARASEPPKVVGDDKPLQQPKPVLPNMRVFVQADVHDRAGLGDLSADRYAEMLKTELTAVVGDYIGREAVLREDPNMTFRDHLAEGREGLKQICELAQAQRVLLADVEIAAAGFSNVDSAYWPEVSYIAINCGDGRVHKSPKKRLEPHRLDAFEFQQQFSRRSQEFVASQGYFLKP